MGYASFGEGNNTGCGIPISWRNQDSTNVPNPRKLEPESDAFQVRNLFQAPIFRWTMLIFLMKNPIPPLLTINCPIISLVSSPTSYQLDKLGRAPIIVPSFYQRQRCFTPGSRDDGQGLGGSLGGSFSSHQKTVAGHEAQQTNMSNIWPGGWFLVEGIDFLVWFSSNHDG